MAAGGRGLQNSPRIHKHFHSSENKPSDEQNTRSLGRYYNGVLELVAYHLTSLRFVLMFYTDLLSHPTSQASSGNAIPSVLPTPSSFPSRSHKDENIAKARIVFGSRLAGPADRRRELDRASTNIAGVLVPPRPDEPDNCCMSGCVNCVWDRYRDELEDWAGAREEAGRRLMMRRRNNVPTDAATSMDDDGGGSETNWDESEILGMGERGRDLFEGVPVGIREFMRTEKRLKERKRMAAG